MGKKPKKENEAPPKDVFDPLSVESKKAQTVVLMLDSPEEEVLGKACESLYKFAEKCDENRALLLEMGAIPPLLRLITNEDKIVRRNAVMALGVMAETAEVRKILRKTDCIPLVIKLLGPEEDTLVHEFGSLCLASMATEYASKVDIFQRDGVEPLVALLSQPDPDVQKNAVETMAHLLQDYHTKAAIRELNGLAPLLELIRSDYPVIQQLALVCLERATQDAENREALREISGLERLVEFVGNLDWSELHVQALLVLSNCLEDPESMELIQGTGGLQNLLKFCSESTLPEVQQNAAMAVARAAKNEENRKIFREQDGEKTLITLLESDNANVQVAAANAISVMVESLSSRAAIGELEGIGPLAKLLHSDNGDVREASSLALANLTNSNSRNCGELVDRSGVDPLIHLLGDSREGAQANAAVALTNMSNDEILRRSIQNKGIVAALNAPLQSRNVTVQSKAALALAAFACDSDTRTELRTSGGLSHLIKLLNSGNNEVRRSASWAVVVCANDSPTSAEICRLGGLDVLQEIEQSSSRRNNFSAAAFERLLDNNLSAKYSLLGRLDPTDITSDGFFDPGQLKPDAKFLSLEDYSKQPVNQKRPILLVNTKIPELFTPTPTPAPSDFEGRDSKPKTAGRSSRGSVRGKKESKKEREEREEREKLEAELLAEQQRLAAEALSKYHCPSDPDLEMDISEVQANIQTLPDTDQQVVALAKYVSDRMGGAVEKENLSDFSYELHTSQLKFELDSNIISIGRIEAGIHYHRALLFKVLGDKIGVSCSLVRGQYNRAWNQVLLSQNQEVGMPKFPPKEFIVDLIYSPGNLLRCDSREAADYQKI